MSWSVRKDFESLAASEKMGSREKSLLSRLAAFCNGDLEVWDRQGQVAINTILRMAEIPEPISVSETIAENLHLMQIAGYLNTCHRMPAEVKES